MAACAALLAVAVPVGVHSAAQARSTSAARSSATKKPASAQAAAPPSLAAAAPAGAAPAGAAPAGAAPGDGIGPDLDAKINGIIDANDQYQIGVALLDLAGDATTGQTVHQYGIQDPFEAASTAKVLAAEAYYHLVETGAASLDDQLGAYSAAFQLQAMIQQSDNDSWSLIEQAVGYQELTDYAASLGVKYNPNDNTLTTADMARILAGLYSGRLLNSADTAQLLSTMQDTNDETLIPAALPAGVTVYHKYGELGGELHDAAILAKDGHTYALVIYTKAEDLGSVQERTDVIHQLTAAVTDAVF